MIKKVKFMTASTGKQIIIIRTFPNISRSKDDRTMTFGQLMEYNMRNIFLGKSFMKIRCKN